MDILTEVLGVFSSVGSWIGSSFTSLTPIFWGTDGLTIMGVLAVCGLAFSVTFLILRTITDFLHFRG